MEATVAISLDFNITSQKQHVNLSKFNHLTFSFFFKQKISPYTKTKITLSEIISQFVPLWDCYQRGMAGETRYTKIRVTSSTMQKLDWRKGWDVHDKGGWCNVNSPIIACLLKKAPVRFPGSDRRTTTPGWGGCKRVEIFRTGTCRGRTPQFFCASSVAWCCPSGWRRPRLGSTDSRRQCTATCCPEMRSATR